MQHRILLAFILLEVLIMSGCMSGGFSPDYYSGVTMMPIDAPRTISSGESTEVSCTISSNSTAAIESLWSAELGSIAADGTTATYTAPNVSYEMLDSILVRAVSRESSKSTSLGPIASPFQRCYIKVEPVEAGDPWIGIAPDSIFLWPDKSIVREGETIKIQLYAWISADKPLSEIRGLDFDFTLARKWDSRWTDDDGLLIKDIRLGSLFDEFEPGEWELHNDTQSNELVIRATGRATLADCRGILAEYEMETDCGIGIQLYSGAVDYQTYSMTKHYSSTQWQELSKYYGPSTGGELEVYEFSHVGRSYGSEETTEMPICVVTPGSAADGPEFLHDPSAVISAIPMD